MVSGNPSSFSEADAIEEADGSRGLLAGKCNSIRTVLAPFYLIRGCLWLLT